MYDTSASLSINTFPVEIMKSAPNSMHEQLDHEAELDEYFNSIEKPIPYTRGWSPEVCPKCGAYLNDDSGDSCICPKEDDDLPF